MVAETPTKKPQQRGRIPGLRQLDCHTSPAHINHPTKLGKHKGQDRAGRRGVNGHAGRGRGVGVEVAVGKGLI